MRKKGFSLPARQHLQFPRRIHPSCTRKILGKSLSGNQAGGIVGRSRGVFGGSACQNAHSHNTGRDESRCKDYPIGFSFDIYAHGIPFGHNEALHVSASCTPGKQIWSDSTPPFRSASSNRALLSWLVNVRPRGSYGTPWRLLEERRGAVLVTRIDGPPVS